MKKLCIITVVFLLAGMYSATAQDLIVMRDGSIIEAKVTEISQTEIRYKRFTYLDGPTVVIPAANVLSIRYENGTTEIITAPPASGRERTQPARSGTDRAKDKFIFGVNANLGSALGYIWEGPSGFCLNFEFGRGNFNSEINLTFPRGGFGFLATFNRIWHNRIGGFYLGGGLGYSFYTSEINADWAIYRGVEGENYGDAYTQHSFTLGLNIGHKFVQSSGLYFRVGIFTGFDFGWLWRSNTYILPVYIKPDLAIGWTMR